MNNTKIIDLSILVNSCDKYDDLWYPYFKLLEINWPNLNYPIYLNTEAKKANISVGKSTVQVINSGCNNKPWSYRLYNALKIIDSEFILFSLDDFFIHSVIDSERIQKIVLFMKDKPNVASFTLYPQNDNNPKLDKNAPEGFFVREKDADYLINCQFAIWRKSILLKLIRKHESPWDFEDLGTIRARKSKYDFYAQIVGQPMCIPYLLSPLHGYGVFNGRWLWNNKYLFEKFEINVDFSKRESFKDKEALEAFVKSKSQSRLENEKYMNSIRCRVKEKLPYFLIRFIRKFKS